MFSGCVKCMNKLNEIMTEQQFIKNKLLHMFINKFNSIFNEHVSIEGNPINNLEDVLSKYGKDATLVRHSYYTFVNEYVINYLYIDRNKIMKDKVLSPNEKFDIYTYAMTTDKVNLEHVVPVSYFRQRNVRMLGDIASLKMSENMMYYNPLIMAPSKHVFNSLRKNFIYKELSEDEKQFIISGHDIILQKDCPNKNQFTHVYMNYETQQQHILSKPKETELTKVKEISTMSGKYCDALTDANLCTTCFIEPIEKSRGDISRTILAFYVANWHNIRDNLSSNEYWKHLTNYLNIYVQWSNKYEVSEYEKIKNNNLIYIIGMCNPFIYHFSNAIIGDKIKFFEVKFPQEFIKHLFFDDEQKNHDKYFSHLEKIQLNNNPIDNQEYDLLISNMVQLHKQGTPLKIQRLQPNNTPQLQPLRQLIKPELLNVVKYNNTQAKEMTGGYYYQKYLKYKMKYLTIKEKNNYLD